MWPLKARSAFAQGVYNVYYGRAPALRREDSLDAKTYPGEFEQMVMLAILQCGGRAFALEVREEIERSASRKVSRGAFYTTLDRLESKGMVSWTERVPDDLRGSSVLRHYEVTAEGMEALRNSREALLRLWRGLDELLGPA